MFEGKLKKTDRKGKVSYNRNIVNSIVTLATSEIEEVIYCADEKSKLCRVDFDEDDVFVDVFIKVKYGCMVSAVACKIQENIKRSVDTMTIFKVKDVNVNIIDVEFD